MEERDVFIISAVRTAIGVGKPGGALHEFHPVDLSAMIMKEAVRRAEVEMDRTFFGISRGEAIYGGTLIRQSGENLQDQDRGAETRYRLSGYHNNVV